MSVVLDATAIVAVAAGHRTKRSIVESILEQETCYMSVVAVAQAYSWLLNNSGERFADHWLDFMLSDRDIRVDHDIDRGMIELVGEARRNPSISPTGAFSAALARRMGVALVTDDERLGDLAERGYCTIRWLLPAVGD